MDHLMSISEALRSELPLEHRSTELPCQLPATIVPVTAPLAQVFNRAADVRLGSSSLADSGLADFG